MKEFKNSLELQALISKGDEGAFEQVYCFYHKKLTAFSRNFVKSRELAEEIVEDVFVKIWCRREDIVNIKNLTVYLYGATKNLSLNALSKESRRLVTESLEIPESDVPADNINPHSLVVTSEMMQSMERAVDMLPPRCKMVFQLIREDGLKYKEVSEILNISVNTIDAQMAIAVKRICAALGVGKMSKTDIRVRQ